MAANKPNCFNTDMSLSSSKAVLPAATTVSHHISFTRVLLPEAAPQLMLPDEGRLDKGRAAGTSLYSWSSLVYMTQKSPETPKSTTIPSEKPS